MTRETFNAENIRRASKANEKFNLSDTGENASAEGYDSHILNYDRATMTPAEFAATYPSLED
jgi:hypothetical protein|tara:strand:- start:170 stop:355 length:186 start_codon:yes stop_codon:yes gene_type:complete